MFNQHVFCRIMPLLLAVLLLPPAAATQAAFFPADPAALSGSCLRATLNTASHVPPLGGSTTGSAILLLTPDRAQLVFYLSFGSVGGTEQIAQIRQGLPGANGPIVVDLGTGSPLQGVRDLTQAQAALLLRGEYYIQIDIITSSGTQGALRGQIWPSGDCFSAALRGDQEVPPNGSSARGSALFALSADRQMLLYRISYSGLSSDETMAHIHIGPRGTNGGIVFDLPGGTPKHGVLSINSTSLTSLRSSLLYVNIHSQALPGGEIRGQIAPASSCFTADLRGYAQVPPNDSTATGRGSFELAADGLTLQYLITYSGLETAEFAQHIRQAPPGVVGSTIAVLPAGTTKRGVLVLTVPQAVILRAGEYYVSIASEALLEGEIRGQIVPTPCRRLLPLISG